MMRTPIIKCVTHGGDDCATRLLSQEDMCDAFSESGDEGNASEGCNATSHQPSGARQSRACPCRGAARCARLHPNFLALSGRRVGRSIRAVGDNNRAQVELKGVAPLALPRNRLWRKLRLFLVQTHIVDHMGREHERRRKKNLQLRKQILAEREERNAKAVTEKYGPDGCACPTRPNPRTRPLHDPTALSAALLLAPRSRVRASQARTRGRAVRAPLHSRHEAT